MIKKIGQILVLALMIIVLAGQGWGDFLPVLINFQGRLTDRDKNALIGTHTVKFDLYQTASDTNSLWTESHDVTVNDNGVFNVLLGAKPTPLLSINWKENYWMEITVDTDAPLSPRQPLIYVPYAITALQAIKADIADNISAVQMPRNINGVTVITGFLYVRPPTP